MQLVQDHRNKESPSPNNPFNWISNFYTFVIDNHSDVHHRGHRDQLVRHRRWIRKALEKSFPTSLAHLLRARSPGKMMTCSSLQFFSNGFNVLLTFKRFSICKVKPVLTTTSEQQPPVN